MGSISDLISGIIGGAKGADAKAPPSAPPSAPAYVGGDPNQPTKALPGNYTGAAPNQAYNDQMAQRNVNPRTAVSTQNHAADTGVQYSGGSMPNAVPGQIQYTPTNEPAAMPTGGPAVNPEQGNPQQTGNVAAPAPNKLPSVTQPVAPAPVVKPTAKISSYDALYGSPATIQVAHQAHQERSALMAQQSPHPFGEKEIGPVDIAGPFNKTQAFIEGKQASAQLPALEQQLKQMRVDQGRAMNPTEELSPLLTEAAKRRHNPNYQKDENEPYIGEKGRVLETMGRQYFSRGGTPKEHGLSANRDHHKLEDSIKRGMDEKLKKKEKK